MNSELFESYLSRLLDRDISAEEFNELEQYLTNSPEARARYIEYVDLETLLELELTKTTPEQLGASKIVDIDRIVRRQNRRTLKIVALSTAAILLIGLISMQLFFTSTAKPALVFETSPGTQYALTHTNTNKTPEGLVLEKGSRLQLTQGAVKLTFKSGVTSVVMAPADLTLRDEDVVFLNQGTARFHVPEEALGFNVITKDLNIVDLGTEFGVLARNDDYNELHVFKGKVKATALHHRKESATLSAGQALRIDSIGKLTAITENPSAFLSTLPDSLPYLHWSFDDEKGIQVTGSHPAVSTIHTKATAEMSFTEGKHGKAVSLDGISQYYATNWPGFEGNKARTVSFWLYLPKDGDYHKFPGIVSWGDRLAGKWKILAVNSKKGAPARIRLSWGDSWITTRKPLTPAQWNHIIITSNGQMNDEGYPRAELYINGQMQTTYFNRDRFRPKQRAYGTQTKTKNSTPLMIGADLFHKRKNKNFLKGKIDELYIFDGYMTKEEVRKQY